MKKRGFGVNRYNGFGGKLDGDETLEEALVRELNEEVGISVLPEHLRKVAELTFIFPHKPEWSQIVHVYFFEQWLGEPMESEEMRPDWFHQDKLPYEKMWPDDKYWLPEVLQGKYVTARFVFANDQSTILEMEVNTKES